MTDPKSPLQDDVTQILSRPTGTMDRKAVLESLRRNITVLFTDLKGSTSYFEKYGDAAGLMMVHRCNTMLSQAVERHSGRVIKTIGDAVMAAFEDPIEAVASAIEMQEAITADNKDKTDAQKIAIRIGVNYGLGLVKSNDIFGDVVNVASRVESAASPEQILISDTLHNVISDSGRFRLRAVGKFALKGKADERALFEVEWKPPGETVPAGSHSMLEPEPEIARNVRFKLVQVRNDGRPGREFAMASGRALIGRADGEFTFPNDATMQPSHTWVSVESGQLFAEPIGEAAAYFSLIGPYRLQPGDIVKMGGQVLEFRVNTAALEKASLTGAGLSELAKTLHGPIAELVSTVDAQKRLPLEDGDTTFGRTKGTHVFSTDSAMSRSHAKVSLRGEDFFIEDTGSTNGTFVRAREKTALPENCILAVAGQLLRVHREVGESKAVPVQS